MTGIQPTGMTERSSAFRDAVICSESLTKYKARRSAGVELLEALAAVSDVKASGAGMEADGTWRLEETGGTDIIDMAEDRTYRRTKA